MTPEEQAALEWYGNLIVHSRGPRGNASAAGVRGAAVAHLAASALRHQHWHVARGEG